VLAVEVGWLDLVRIKDLEAAKPAAREHDGHVRPEPSGAADADLNGSNSRQLFRGEVFF